MTAAKGSWFDAIKSAVWGGTSSSTSDDAPVNEASLSHWLPYRYYIEDEQVFINTDTVGFVLRMTPQTGADDEMLQIMQGIYDLLPSGASLQMSLFANPNIQDRLAEYANLRLRDDDLPDHQARYAERRQEAEAQDTIRHENIFRSQARKRYAHLKRAATHSLIPGFHYYVRQFELIASVTLPGSLNDNSQIERLVQLRQAMQSTLQSSGLRSRVMDAEGLLNWVANLVNPTHLKGQGHRLQYSPYQPLHQQMVYQDTVSDLTAEDIILREGLRDQAPLSARFFSVRQYPKEFSLWQFSQLIGHPQQTSLQYPCPFLITMGIHIPDESQTKNMATFNFMNTQREAESPMAKWMPTVKDRFADWQHVMNRYNDGGKLVWMYHKIALFSPQERAIAAENDFKAIWSAKGFTVVADEMMHRQSLLASLPMTLSQGFFKDLQDMRYVSYKEKMNAVNLAPVLAEWAGTPTPALLLTGRRGQLMGLDLYDAREGGMNAAVVGTTGSGKSVMCNELVMSCRAMGGRVWIFDLGRSYKKLCDKVGGQFIEFGPKSRICVNPFSGINPDDWAEEYEVILPLIAEMASPRESMNGYQYRVLGNVINQVWAQHGNKTTITPMWEILNQGRLQPDDAFDQRIKDLAVMLQPFTADGVFAPFFEGESTINFTSDFIVLELEELKSRPEMYKIMLMVMMHQVSTGMYHDRSRQKMLLVDESKEFWSAQGANNETMALFLAGAYTRVRKYGGSVVTAAQGFDQYYVSKAGETALNNANWWLMLKQGKNSIDMLKKFNESRMDDGFTRLLKSVHTQEGVYSEIMIDGPMGQGVGRLFLDPYSLLLYSNNQTDNNALDSRMAQGMTLDEAIADTLRERNIEVAQ